MHTDDAANTPGTGAEQQTHEQGKPDASEQGTDWRAHWAALGQPWRTEPEVSAERQAYLAERRAIQTNFRQGIAPFEGIALARADVEWLLATHTDDSEYTGPVNFHDEDQLKKRTGLVLRGADLRSVDLSGLPLDLVYGCIAQEQAKELVGTPAEHTGHVLLDGANLSGASLNGATLSGAPMNGVNLSGASLIRARLDGAQLSGATLTGARLESATVSQADLTDADLSGATLAKAGLSECTLDRARFDKASLEEAYLGSARGSATSFAGASLIGASFYHVQLDHANFAGALLQNAKFQSSQVLVASFAGADLSQRLGGDAPAAGADFMLSDLTGADFTGAALEGVTLTDSTVPWQRMVAGYPTPPAVGAPATGEVADRAAARERWEAADQPWRTEPEISAERQAYLAERRAIVADPHAEVYPFKGIALSRADVEWLLATHEEGRGPVDWTDEKQRQRWSIDVRGADLRRVDLSELPLARLRAGLDNLERIASQGGEYTSEARAHAAAARVHLEGADLSGAHLEGAVLCEGYLQRAALRDAHLEKANVEYGHLEWVSLERAHLDGATFNSGHCEGADLSGAVLRRVSAFNSVFTQANLEGADLTDATVLSATFDATRIDRAIFVGAGLNGLKLREVSLRVAQLQRASLEKVDLREQDLSGLDLTGVSLADANLEAGHLEGAILRGAKLGNASLRGAHLERADLREARLDGADSLGGGPAVLTDAHLEDALLDGANLARVDLSGAHLEGATLTQARVTGANLAHARLAGADLRGAICDGATGLDGAILADDTHGPAALLDVTWGGATLAGIDWTPLAMLGDEARAAGRRDAAGKRRARAERFATEVTVVRAYTELADALAEQGLAEEAAHYAHRARILQRRLLWRQRSWGQWLFSAFLAVLTGYGYRLGRILIAYLLIVGLSAAAYFALGRFPGETTLSASEALLVSVMAFHGRVFSEQFTPGTPQVWVSAVEAVFGVVIEGVFIAMLTQRFFGK